MPVPYGHGDRLAYGVKSAAFGPPKVTQEKWDAIWKEDKPLEQPKKPKKK